MSERVEENLNQRNFVKRITISEASMNSILIEKKNQISGKSHVMGFFSRMEGAGFFEWCEWTAEKELEMLVFRVSRKPKFLEAHVERIYHCLMGGLDSQLYGALLDLLIVLDGCGLALVSRILIKAKSRLTHEELNKLLRLFNKGQGEAVRLTSPYSVFSEGVQGRKELLQLRNT